MRHGSTRTLSRMRRVIQAMSVTMVFALLCACGSDANTTSDVSEQEASSQASPDEVTHMKERSLTSADREHGRR